ncbi:helix-turn-helix domain-containing protein [Streptomyces sp. NPDC060000]|uniref:helix-turn-helix domain-containing protein n=1 Tax=Streptomyces sp. NPDC060000 TaxID=3347031 RepID=UPI00369E0BDD
MTKPYVIELEPEVRAWLANLSPQHYRRAEEKTDLLARSPTTLGEPHDRRVALALTRAALSERLGMPPGDVETIELGGMPPLTADLLVRLATALDVTVDLHVVSGGHNTVVFEERAA